MLILSNLNIQDNLSFKELENKEWEAEYGNLKIVGREKDIGCNLYTIQHSDTDTISTINLTKAILIECEIQYETGLVQDSYTRKDLIRSFGSKKSVDRLQSIEKDGYLKRPTLKISNKSQILPIVHDGKNIQEYFLLEDMVDKKIIDKLKTVEVDFLNETKRFYHGVPDVRLVIIDGLIRLLNMKYMTKDVFYGTPYISMTDMFIEEIENRRLTNISRDRFIVLVYILILQVEGGRVRLCSIPNFNMSVNSVLHYFQILGCYHNKATDEIKAVTKPVEYTNKKY